MEFKLFSYENWYSGFCEDHNPIFFDLDSSQGQGQQSGHHGQQQRCVGEQQEIH